MDVHTWGEQHIAAIFEHLVADAVAHAFDEFLVPGAGQGSAYGEARGIICVGIALTRRTNAHTGRAIGQYGGRDAQTGDGTCSTSCARHHVGVLADDAIGSCITLSVAISHAERCLLLEGHGLEDFVDVVFLQFQLSHRCARHQQCSGCNHYLFHIFILYVTIQN